MEDYVDEKYARLCSPSQVKQISFKEIIKLNELMEMAHAHTVKTVSEISRTLKNLMKEASVKNLSELSAADEVTMTPKEQASMKVVDLLAKLATWSLEMDRESLDFWRF